jgi:photosystem II Psb27 protein
VDCQTAHPPAHAATQDMRVLFFLLLVAGATAFRSIANTRTSLVLKALNNDGIPRSMQNIVGDEVKKNIVYGLGASLAILLAPIANANAADVATKPTTEVKEEKIELGPPPTDFGIKNSYYEDCQKVVNHMRYAVQLEKGNPILADFAQKTKDEMLDFVSFYRRFNGVNGKQTFSLLYTSINVLAGHYTSYGIKFPVPEKRRKRLLQEFNDIEKNIKKRR